MSPLRRFAYFSVVIAATAVSAFAQSITYAPDETKSANQSITGPTNFDVESGAAVQSGNVSGSGSVIKTGEGTLTFSAVNSYSGGTTVSAGTLISSIAGSVGTGNVTIAGGNYLLQGNITVGRNVVVTSNGTLGAHNAGGVNTYSGNLVLDASTSTLTLNAAGTNRVNFTGPISGNIGMLEIVGTNSGVTGNFEGRVLVTSPANFTGNVTIVNNGGGQLGLLHLATDMSNQAVTNNGVLVLSSDDGNSGNRTIGALSGNGVVRVLLSDSTQLVNFRVGAQNTSSTFSGSIQRDAYNNLDFNGAIRLEKIGTGTLTLNGTNAYIGGTTLTGGTLALGSAGALSSGGTILFNGGQLQFSADNTTDYSNRFSSAAGQNVKIDTNGEAVSFASNLVSDGGMLTKNGEGTLTLLGSNTYGGGTTLNGGTLVLGSAGAIGTTGSISFNGGQLRYSAANNTDYSSRFSTAQNQTVQIDTGGQDVTFATPFTGTDTGFVKYGSGNLTLLGDHSYGSVQVEGGELHLGATGVGGASVDGYITVGNFGSSVRFLADSTVGPIMVNSTGWVYFQDDSSAGNATLNNNYGVLTFQGNATASNATINSVGYLFFIDSATAGSANITGYSKFQNSATAGSATFQGGGFFEDESSAGSAHFTVENGDSMNFMDSTTAGSATIVVASGTQPYVPSLSFSDDSSAGSATITNHGLLNFYGDSSMGTATITNTGRTTTTGNITAYEAKIINSSGGTLDLSGMGGYQGYIEIGALSGAGTTTLGNTTLRVGSLNTNTTISGSIKDYVVDPDEEYYGMTGGSLVKVGTGTLTLTGNNTYTGPTNVTNGTLVVNGSLTSSLVTVELGTTLSGSGTINALLVDSGGQLSPGNSPGTLTAGNTTLAMGSSFRWEINDATGVAGTNWDLLNVQGVLTLAGTAEAPIMFRVVSLTSGNAAGSVINFNPNQAYSYTLISASGGVVGFDEAAVYAYTAGFANSFTGTWSIGLSLSGNDILLNYAPTAIPEPSTYAAILGVAALGLMAFRRRQKNARS